MAKATKTLSLQGAVWVWSGHETITSMAVFPCACVEKRGCATCPAHEDKAAPNNICHDTSTWSMCGCFISSVSLSWTAALPLSFSALLSLLGPMWNLWPVRTKGVMTVAILIYGGADTCLCMVCFVSSNVPYSSSYTFHGHTALPVRNLYSWNTGIAHESLTYPGIGFASSANVPSTFYKISELKEELWPNNKLLFGSRATDDCGSFLFFLFWTTIPPDSSGALTFSLAWSGLQVMRQRELKEGSKYLIEYLPGSNIGLAPPEWNISQWKICTQFLSWKSFLNQCQVQLIFTLCSVMPGPFTYQ